MSRCLAAGSFMLYLLLAAATSSLAAPVTLSAVDQGFWSATYNNSSLPDSYTTGNDGTDDTRGFVSFDLSGLSGPITSAILRLERFQDGADNENPESFGLFAVATAPAALHGTGMNGAIYTDLGDGASYGSFDISNAPLNPLEFSLNSNAIAAINALINTPNTIFSVGFALLSDDGVDDYLFGLSDASGPQELDVELAPLSTVPEPSTLALFVTGISGVLLGRVRRRRA